MLVFLKPGKNSEIICHNILEIQLKKLEFGFYPYPSGLFHKHWSYLSKSYVVYVVIIWKKETNKKAWIT